MEFIENKLICEDYVSLTSSAGWSNFVEKQALRCVQNSIYTVTASEQGEAVAMGRLIGDGVYYMLADIVVKPECQNKGIGSRIADMLLRYADRNTPIGGRASVQLISEKGKEGFYIKKGFKTIPHESCGTGMRKIIRK